MRKLNSIATDPTPRISDIMTVRNAGELDQPDEAASDLAFRQWLITYHGTTKDMIKGSPVTYELFTDMYNDHLRRQQVEFSDQGSIWQAVAEQWVTNRAQFVRWIVTGVIVVGLGLLVFFVVR